VAKITNIISRNTFVKRQTVRAKKLSREMQRVPGIHTAEISFTLGLANCLPLMTSFSPFTKLFSHSNKVPLNVYPNETSCVHFRISETVTHISKDSRKFTSKIKLLATGWTTYSCPTMWQNSLRLVRHQDKKENVVIGVNTLTLINHTSLSDDAKRWRNPTINSWQCNHCSHL